MTMLTEIAPSLFRISTYFPEMDLQFNQFLIKDDEPLLFHTGLKKMFPMVRDAVSRIIEPTKLRWIVFSHYEADECGSLNDWLEVAPDSRPACSVVGAIVNINDVASRAPRRLKDNEVLSTGSHRLRFLATPHVPHAWDAGLLFEETGKTLLSSDLFHHSGDVEPITEDDVAERAKKTLIRYQDSPLANYMPYTPYTEETILNLAALKPKKIATMHGSTFAGDGEKALRDLASIMREVLGTSQG